MVLIMNETLENIRENPKQFLKDVGMNLVIVITSLSYIAYQLVGLKDVGIGNPLTLIAGAIISILCGVTIKQALGENGFTLGYKSDEWLNEKRGYDNACNDVIQYMDKVDNFYQYQEIEKRRNYRRAVLQAKRMKYEMWFDVEGNYIGTKEMVKKLTIWQKLALHKAIRVKVYVKNLFSEYSKSAEEDVKKEKTDANQRTRSGIGNTISAVLISAISVYFVPFFKEWSPASLIAATIQVALWILFGFINLAKNYNFVTKVKTAVLREKKKDMSKFKSGCENRIYDYGPYDKQEPRQIGMFS